MVILVTQQDSINKIIQSYRKRDYDTCINLYKRLSNKTIKYISIEHNKLHTTIIHYFYKTLLRKKLSLDLFVEYWISHFSLLSLHQKKEFFYVIYVYIQKCENLFFKKKLQQTHKDMLSVVIDVFGTSRIFNVSSQWTSSSLSSYTISYKRFSRIILTIPNYLVQSIRTEDLLT